MIKKSKYKIFDPVNCTMGEYINYHAPNPSRWAYYQTKTFAEEVNGVPKMCMPHYFQKVVMNLTFNNIMTIVLKCRQCLKFDSLILLDNDEHITIGNLFYNFSNFGKEYKIVSYDKDGNRYTDEVIDIWNVGEKETYLLQTYDGQFLICTEDHKINTLSGFKKLKDLQIDDYILVENEKDIVESQISVIEYYGKEECYDLTTKKHHNYIANNISVHNSGFSTCITSLFVHNILFGFTKNVLFLSISRVQAEKLMDKFYNAVETIVDPRFKLVYKRKTRQECEFVNGVTVTSLSSNPNTMIGFTGSILWDECGKFNRKESDEISSNIFPSLTKEGNRMYIISTPFGKNNQFYDLCKKYDPLDPSTEQARMENPRIKLYRVHYKDVPHIDIRSKILKSLMGTNISGWNKAYELKFDEETEESLFTYDLMIEKTVDSKIEIIPYDLDELTRIIEKSDGTKKFVHDISPLYPNEGTLQVKIFEKILSTNKYESNQFIYTGKKIHDELDGWVHPFRNRVLCYDPAKNHDDAGFAILDQCLDMTYRVIGTLKLRKVGWNVQMDILEHLARMFQCNRLAYGAASVGSFIMDYIYKINNTDGKYEYPYLANKSKISIHGIDYESKIFKYNIYTKMKTKMNDGKFKIYSDVGLIDEFVSLKLDSLTAKISHDKGTFIDRATAIMLGSSLFFNDGDDHKKDKTNSPISPILVVK